MTEFVECHPKPLKKLYTEAILKKLPRFFNNRSLAS